MASRVGVEWVKLLNRQAIRTAWRVSILRRRSMAAAPSRNARNLSAPMPIASESPIADQTE